MRGKDIIVESHRLADIFIVGERRPLVEADIDALARSIEAIGLRSPIWIRYVDLLDHPEEGELHGAFVLVAGRHRMEAMKRLGREMIDCIVFQGDEVAARKWEIAENLHRSDLTDLQRKEQIAEWIRLTAQDKGAQLAPPGGHQPHDKGIKAAVRDLGIKRDEAQRAVKVASISEQAKQAAIDAHLDNNQSALLKIARAAPEQQVSVVAEITEAKALKVQQDIQNRAATEIAEILVGNLHADAIEAIRVNLAVTTSKAITAALANLVGESIMDRRHA